MQLIKGTPTGQSTLIQFQSHLLNICEISPNHLSISFEQFSKNLKHQINNYQLKKVNYKTIINSLRGQHPNILTTKLQRNPDQLYQLKIKVSYQFLPQVEQIIIFQKRELNQEQLKQSNVRSMRGHLYSLKQQISSLSSIQVKISQITANFQEFIKLPYPKALVSWTLHIQKPSDTLMKCQMYTYNTATREKVSSKIIPQEGLYIHHNGLSACVQLRFIAQITQKYDQTILSIDGKWKGKSIVSLESL